ncbi:MAG: 2-oxoacid:acceptor oxidoreductase family protein [Gemmatimonadetes bacterium]|nr:2-oxoacid:acceptor oxidoreductase family protein [Gemmatimonadota bacterium]
METGKYVQAFPEYGPERSGAPMRAYNRSDERPIRRRYGVLAPDVVVVLDASLLEEVDVTGGLKQEGLLIVNSETVAGRSRLQSRFSGNILCIPADRLASEAGSRFPSVVLLGALAAARGEPPLDALRDAVRRDLGAKLSAAALAANLAGLQAGYDAVHAPQAARA